MCSYFLSGSAKKAKINNTQISKQLFYVHFFFILLKITVADNTALIYGNNMNLLRRKKNDERKNDNILQFV